MEEEAKLIVDDHPLVEVVRGDFPVVLSVPHAGHKLPKDMKEHVSRSRPGDKDADLLAYEILEEGKRLGVRFSLVRAQGRRSLLELNWGESETNGTPALEEYYWAYMNAIRDLLEEARRQHGGAILLDVHGYLESNHKDAKDIGLMPGDIVFGTSFGRLIPQDKRSAYDTFKCSIREAGFSDFPRRPFDEYVPLSGGDIVCRFGGRDHLAAIQMEVPSRIRLDEESRGKLARTVAKGLIQFANASS